MAASFQSLCLVGMQVFTVTSKQNVKLHKAYANYGLDCLENYLYFTIVTSRHKDVHFE